jgi:hypothetical protein
MELVNTRLLAHPVNWAFVFVTLLLAAITYKVIHDAIVNSGGGESVAPD